MFLCLVALRMAPSLLSAALSILGRRGLARNPGLKLPTVLHRYVLGSLERNASTSVGSNRYSTETLTKPRATTSKVQPYPNQLQLKPSSDQESLICCSSNLAPARWADSASSSLDWQSRENKGLNSWYRTLRVGLEGTVGGHCHEVLRIQKSRTKPLQSIVYVISHE